MNIPTIKMQVIKGKRRVEERVRETWELHVDILWNFHLIPKIYINLDFNFYLTNSFSLYFKVLTRFTKRKKKSSALKTVHKEIS